PKLRRGLRIRGTRGNPEVRRCLIRFARWLRNNYEFPRRVPVYLLPHESFTTCDGERVVSSFFAPFDRKEEPYIRIATGDYLSERKKRGRDDALASDIGSLCRQLIHYWQWLDTGKTSDVGIDAKVRSMLRQYSRTVNHP